MLRFTKTLVLHSTVFIEVSLRVLTYIFNFYANSNILHYVGLRMLLVRLFSLHY